MHEKGIKNQPSDSEDSNSGWPDSKHTIEVSNLSMDHDPNRYKLTHKRRITDFRKCSIFSWRV